MLNGHSLLLMVPLLLSKHYATTCLGVISLDFRRSFQISLVIVARRRRIGYTGRRKTKNTCRPSRYETNTGIKGAEYSSAPFVFLVGEDGSYFAYGGDRVGGLGGGGGGGWGSGGGGGGGGCVVDEYGLEIAEHDGGGVDDFL